VSAETDMEEIREMNLQIEKKANQFKGKIKVGKSRSLFAM
jgi:hypothetical protein